MSYISKIKVFIKKYSLQLIILFLVICVLTLGVFAMHTNSKIKDLSTKTQISVETESISKPEELPTETAVIKPKTKTKTFSVRDSWEVTYPAWGTVRIPTYEERIKRISNICAYIEGPMRQYIPDSMSGREYCSWIGPLGEPNVSYDLRDLMLSSKTTVEANWDIILAFESVKEVVIAPRIRVLQSIGQAQAPSNIQTYSSNTVNCTQIKSELQNYLGQTNNVNSSWGAKLREQYKQQYPDCF